MIRRMTLAAAGLGLAVSLLLQAAEPAQAQTPKPARPSVSSAPADLSPTDLSSQQRRPPRRLRIYPRNAPDGVYPRFNPGPNAVRECTATYVQEYRPSGTVITPRMSCFWRRG
ncbi:hypothetical protein RPD_0500 [Rhodopseudomonas palustris BisB5]|uniref:Uncharacterized protein n=1 Tax=Rhodopseudomonas palustris (strain BisB5) TaxID=316057 RepID=Q13DV1_RHOPS|nr:hypothetical protein RPD_0500 [Rhodopseudomonas palustris BisB5]